MAVIEVLLRHMLGEFQPNFLAICKPNYNGSTALWHDVSVCTGDARVSSFERSTKFHQLNSPVFGYGQYNNTLVCHMHL